MTYPSVVRDILVAMYYQHGDSIAAIAKHSKLSQSTVRRILTRMRMYPESRYPNPLRRKALNDTTS